MILVDTSVWADHLRRRDGRLTGLLGQGAVMMHAMIIAELALGPITDRDRTVRRLTGLPHLPTASDADFLAYCADRPVVGRGIGVIDVHLLIAAEQHGDIALWTRDHRLADTAVEIGVTVEGR